MAAPVGRGSIRLRLDYARDVATLALAYQTGYFNDPADPSRIELRKSDDDGASFGAPVIVAARRDLGDGDYTQVRGPVELAVSRDGQTIAALHAEVFCDAVFGCEVSNTYPKDVVLSVSEDGGASFERVGVIASSIVQNYDIAIAADGSAVLMVVDDFDIDASVFVRAERTLPGPR